MTVAGKLFRMSSSHRLSCPYAMLKSKSATVVGIYLVVLGKYDAGVSCHLQSSPILRHYESTLWEAHEIQRDEGVLSSAGE